MHLSTLFGLGLLSALPFVQGAAHQHRRHTFQFRAPSNNETETHSLEKRAFDNARYTFYDVGLGACGKVNVASDFIVALNSPQFGGGYPGPNCFKSITIQAKGKTTTATIMDECPGCPYSGLDMSRGLFTFFAPESEGVIYGSWWFNDGGDSGPKNPDPPKTTKTPDPTTPAWTPTTSSTPKWTPPTTSEEPKWTPPPTSSTEWKEPSTSSTHESSSSSSSSAPPSSTPSVAPSSSDAPPSSSAPTSSATPTPSQASAIQAAEQALLNIVGLYVAGANVN